MNQHPWQIGGVLLASLLAVFCIVAFIFFTFIQRTLQQPMDQIIAKMEEVVNTGNFTHIPKSSSRELGELAEYFNAMVDKLNESIEKMKSLYYRKDLLLEEERGRISR